MARRNPSQRARKNPTKAMVARGRKVLLNQFYRDVQAGLLRFNGQHWVQTKKKRWWSR